RRCWSWAVVGMVVPLLDQLDVLLGADELAQYLDHGRRLWIEVEVPPVGPVVRRGVATLVLPGSQLIRSDMRIVTADEQRNVDRQWRGGPVPVAHRHPELGDQAGQQQVEHLRFGEDIRWDTAEEPQRLGERPPGKARQLTDAPRR